jgi:hypothetical protein
LVYNWLLNKYLFIKVAILDRLGPYNNIKTTLIGGFKEFRLIFRQLEENLQVEIRYPGNPGNTNTDEESRHFNGVKFSIHYRVI